MVALPMEATMLLSSQHRVHCELDVRCVERESRCENPNIEYFNWTRHEVTRELKGWQYQYELDLPVRTEEFTPRVEKDGHIIDCDFSADDHHEKKIYSQNLFFCSGDVPCATNPHDSHELRAGFRKRIVPDMPEPDKSKLRSLGLFVQKWLVNNLQPLENLSNSYEVLFEDWLQDNNSYSGERKMSLSESFESLRHCNIGPLCENDYKIKSFIKREFYEGPKYVRLINSRTDRFKVKVAPYIHAIEKALFHQSEASRYFVKGDPITELPEKLSRLQKWQVILETDYSSFESGFSPEYVDVVECQLWRYMLQNNPEILDAVMKCYYVRKGKIKKPRVERLRSKYYTGKCVGARMSGEMWTSLANGFSNLMNMLFMAEDKGFEVDGFVEGDDGLFGMSGQHLTASDYEQLGFKIKMLYGPDLRHTSFCGNVFDPEEKLLIISPEQIARLSWSCAPGYLNARKKKKLALLRAKAMSLYCTGKHTPIASVLAMKVMELIGPGITILEPGTWYWKANLLNLAKTETFESVEITNRSRNLFADYYHVPICDQLEIEKFYRSASTLEELSTEIMFMRQHNIENLRYRGRYVSHENV